MSPAVVPAVEADALGKRYGSLWALQDCTVSIPAGHVTALVGPNGAGKTTLLRILAGLARPSAGTARVLGRAPEQDRAFLADIGYLAQDVPLYRRLTALDHIEIGAALNARWSGSETRARLRQLEVPVDRPVATLSGGQRAQVALALALAKQPRLLLLDEPVAALDPLARRAFLSSLVEAVAETELSVVLSSHLVHDLERVCDHLLLVGSSRVQLCDDIETILDQHRTLVGPRSAGGAGPAGAEVVTAVRTASQTRILARVEQPIVDPAWEVAEVGLEDIVLAYMEHRGAPSETADHVGAAS